MASAPVPAPGVIPQVRHAGAVQSVEDYFVYNVEFLDIAPAEVQQGNIQIQADSDFKWVAATFQADIAAAAYNAGDRPIPLVNLQIVDTGSGRQLFFNALPIETIFGSGQLPFILPIPRIFRARSSIALTMSNFDAAETYNVRLALIGTKIFTAGGRVL